MASSCYTDFRDTLFDAPLVGNPASSANFTCLSLSAKPKAQTPGVGPSKGLHVSGKGACRKQKPSLISTSMMPTMPVLDLGSMQVVSPNGRGVPASGKGMAGRDWTPGQHGGRGRAPGHT